MDSQLVVETKTRSIVKTIAWRVVATLNSFLVLIGFPNHAAIISALIMNLTGFIIYYLYERLWTKIKWGRS